MLTSPATTVELTLLKHHNMTDIVKYIFKDLRYISKFTIVLISIETVRTTEVEGAG